MFATAFPSKSWFDIFPGFPYAYDNKRTTDFYRDRGNNDGWKIHIFPSFLTKKETLRNFMSKKNFPSFKTLKCFYNPLDTQCIAFSLAIKNDHASRVLRKAIEFQCNSVKAIFSLLLAHKKYLKSSSSFLWQAWEGTQQDE